MKNKQSIIKKRGLKIATACPRTRHGITDCALRSECKQRLNKEPLLV